ncbi:MAG TPA: ribulose-phosphate 3-epimerase [Clostridia bacterium]|nr:ribulose-phosphate 3-epimerase [Clostridia bacterium]
MIEIAPSVLAAHPLYVARNVGRLLDAGITLLHLDIMDGHFVPNISFGPAMVNALHQQYPDIRLDVHLMLSRPASLLDAFIKAGASEITLHSEAEGDLRALLQTVRAAGLRAGLSIKPATAVDTVLPYLDVLDLVLIMSVEPGFGGQKLMADTLSKMGQLRQAGFQGALSVDGGVKQDNAGIVKRAGATRLVMGTAAFTAPDPRAFLAAVRQA